MQIQSKLHGMYNNPERPCSLGCRGITAFSVQLVIACHTRNNHLKDSAGGLTENDIQK